VPIIIVDELDSLKKSKDTQVRWRARHTLAVLDHVFAGSTGPAHLAPQDFSALGSGGIPRGEVTIELVF
jgi:predicted ribonuclease YlaK